MAKKMQTKKNVRTKKLAHDWSKPGRHGVHCRACGESLRVAAGTPCSAEPYQIRSLTGRKLEEAVVEAALKCGDDILPNRLQAAINALRAHRKESA